MAVSPVSLSAVLREPVTLVKVLSAAVSVKVALVSVAVSAGVSLTAVTVCPSETATEE